jgi:hypothetical protein
VPKRKPKKLCAVPRKRGAGRRRASCSLDGNVADYGMAHRPPEDGPPLHDLLAPGSPAPKDIYTASPSWYTGFPQYVWPVSDAMRGKRGKPDSLVHVFRAGPKAELNPGDWIALAPEYAKEHRDSIDPESYKVCGFKVPASTVRWAGDDLMEWGYWGPEKKGIWGSCKKSSQYRGPKSRKK